MYGLGKTHKKTDNGIPPSRPIFPAIDTSSYKLAKFLLKFLTPSISNEFTVIDSFDFPEEICQRDSNLHMASLDVDLYLLIFPYRKPSTFVLRTCTMTNENPPHIPEHDLHDLLNIAT